MTEPLSLYAEKRRSCFEWVKCCSWANFWRHRCGCKQWHCSYLGSVNAELAGLSSSFDPAPCRPAREIVNVSKHFSCNSLRSMCVQGSSNPQYAKEYEIFLKMLKPAFNMIPPRPHNAHPRVFFTDENRTDMVFVIDVPANMFDMQFIYGDEILESEFTEAVLRPYRTDQYYLLGECTHRKLLEGFRSRSKTRATRAKPPTAPETENRTENRVLQQREVKASAMCRRRDCRGSRTIRVVLPLGRVWTGRVVAKKTCDESVHTAAGECRPPLTGLSEAYLT
jgi:uracil-DNA glycosylase